MDYCEEIKMLHLMQQTYSTLFSMINKLQIKGDQYFKELTSRQFMTMMAVLHLQEDDTNLNNIAKKLGTTKQNVNMLIRSIEKKGYFSITRNPNDKRALKVSITDSGKQVMLECNERGLDFFADIFARFTMEELETLWGLLKKLYSADGEDQNGFEEDVSRKIQTTDEYDKKLLERFSKRRKHIE